MSRGFSWPRIQLGVVLGNFQIKASSGQIAAIWIVGASCVYAPSLTRVLERVDTVQAAF